MHSFALAGAAIPLYFIVASMIYIVEDDSEIREMETYALRNAGFEVAAFDCGKAMDEHLRSSAAGNEKPSLFILDIMLPGEDGLSILKRLRAQSYTSQIPVMMLTAKGTELDKVKGLDSGADDYLTKPFGILEFISRVKALLRRATNTAAGAAAPGTENTLQVGCIRMDDSRHIVTINDAPCEFTFKEYELLKLLMQKPGNVFTRQEIMTRVWGVDFTLETRTVDMHIKTLRQKLGNCGDIIKTIRNIGYKAEA